MSVPRPTWLLAFLLMACGGGSTGPQPVDQPILVVGLARLDQSMGQTLTGYLALFYDVDRDSLLTAQVRVNARVLDCPPPTCGTFEAGAVPGPIYFRGSIVKADTVYQLVATIHSPEGDIEVVSANVVAPSLFEVTAPSTHAANQPLLVTWEPVTNASAFNITVVNTGFQTEVSGTTTSVTLPASAFTGLQPGQVVEIEVTAFNGFYVSFADIATLGDAEEAILRFTESENITGNGTRGTFATATTIGVTVTIQ
jgi:hypothetical protein